MFSYLLTMKRIIWACLLFTTCTPPKTPPTMHENALAKETSPYLLQHAQNPVDWVPWSEDVFEKAEKGNKLVIVSIGYSACHWCHVMEHESFEDSVVAELMNDHFISVKVDREEYPDIDQYYMTAVQLMTNQGGWPLNVVCLPDGRPVWGGTYFPKKDWMNALQYLVQFQEENPSKMKRYAEELASGVRKAQSIVPKDPGILSEDEWKATIAKWKSYFDTKLGGYNRAPKFPLPTHYDFLLDYGLLHQDEEILNQVELTLDHMAAGGIYDQIGGGFARYSTDIKWLAPHFEKMLYDNGQLLGLYSKAYRVFKKERYKTIVLETLGWMNREMLDSTGLYYSALDADSEGEEGKFYTWTESEAKSLLGNSYPLAEKAFGFDGPGFWEEGKHILIQEVSTEALATIFNQTEQEIQEKLESIKSTLFDARSKRIRPGLDYKCLLSWNALCLTGLVEAHRAFPNHLEINSSMNRLAKAIMDNLHIEGEWHRQLSKGELGRKALFEDLAITAEALLNYSLVKNNSAHLTTVQGIVENVFIRFKPDTLNFFQSRPLGEEGFMAPSFETQDNVMPSANAKFAQVLFKLNHIESHPDWEEHAFNMLSQMHSEILHYPPGAANWMQLGSWFNTHVEWVIIGDSAKGTSHQYGAPYLPNTLIAVSAEPSDLALFANRHVEGETLHYICVNKACDLPVKDGQHAIRNVRDKLGLK